MQKKIRSRIAAPLILSAMLFILPVGAVLTNSGGAMPVYAGEDVSCTEEGEDSSAEEGEESGGESQGNHEEIGESGKGEENGEEGEESEESEIGEATEPEAACICDSRCRQYEIDQDCPICSADFEKCAYEEPGVKITINAPSGWHAGGTSAKVAFRVEDMADTGNFTVKSVQAKIGQNGSYQDVTEDMFLEISENCAVYVLVTDARDKCYERSRSIRCFDTVKPTLNAAVSDGLLTIQASDHDSGVKKVYVNGYEFTDVTNGTVNIRLSQFDAGYEYFTISAMDAAGNMSEVYKTKNPYYKDPQSDDDGNPAEQLPVSAEPTKPSSATAQVTEHTKTDADGNEELQAQGTDTAAAPAVQKKEEFAKADAEEEALENNGSDGEAMKQGKEFYTIQAAGGKVFYLVIDRDGEEELVYFLTEITENDLLNVTGDNSETLPKNSAALESQIPVADSALPNNNVETDDAHKLEEPQEQMPTAEQMEDGTEASEADEEEAGQLQEAAKGSPVAGYLFMAFLGVCVIGAAYYFKAVRKKRDSDFIEDEDEDEDDEYEPDEAEKEDGDDFFNRAEDAAGGVDQPDSGEKEREA